MPRWPGSAPAALLGLALGCTPRGQEPAPAPPPGDPQTIIDARGTPVDDGSAGSATSPEAHDINAAYREQTDPRRWAKRFERPGREVHDRREAILSALELRSGMRVADVGAGTGLFSLALARAVGPEGRVFAVDLQAYFLDHIRGKASEAGLTNLETIQATQKTVGLPARSIDLAFFCDAYHHIDQPVAYMRTVHAALRPGGRVVVVDYRRVEGQSEAWMLEHIRADPATFRAEIESAGFRFVQEHEGLLRENFFFVFERR